MSLIERNQSFIFSSSPANGAVNLSSDGSSFDVQLDTPIYVPRDAVSAELSVTSASIWWTIGNITEALKNNKLYIYSLYNDGGGPPAGSPNFEITIPDGLYSVTLLNQTIGQQLVNLGLPKNLIVVGGDDATQKGVLTFNNGGYQTYIDFTQADTFRDILGFNSRQAPLPADQSEDGFNEYSDNVASFNTISSFLINTNLISSGIPINNIGGGAICNVPVDVSPGRLINYNPRHPDIADASELIGQRRNNINMRLTDQDRRLVDTNDEYWSCTLRLTYWQPSHMAKPNRS